MSQACQSRFQESSVGRPSPHVFHAKQLMVDDSKAPVLPPDFIQGIQFTSVDDARQQYKEIRCKHRRKRNQYAPGALYKNLFLTNSMVLDHDVVGDFDISIDYVPPTRLSQQKKLKSMDGNFLPMATTIVKVRSARSQPSYLDSLYVVDAQLVPSKGAVRQGRGDVGRMWQVGVKNRGLMTKNRKHYKATESAFIKTDKTNVAGSPFLLLMNCQMCEFMRHTFPKEYQEIQHGNQGMAVDRRIGGDGSLHTFSISRDLGNSSHLDTGDKSVSICTWVEEKPGTAKNWFFILPNTTLLDDASKAVVIKLSHGLTISWDGRYLHHCTSITDTGEKNHVYGNFTTTSKARTLG